MRRVAAKVEKTSELSYCAVCTRTDDKCPTCRADVTVPSGSSANQNATPVTLATDSDPAVQAPRTWAWRRLLASFRRQRIVLHERNESQPQVENNGGAAEGERLV